VVPTADRQKATVQVKVSILDRDPRILPEMGAKVSSCARPIRPPRARRAACWCRAPRWCMVPAAIACGWWRTARRRRAPSTWDPVDDAWFAETLPGGLDGGETIVIGAPARLKDGAAVRVKRS
jgi:hypothetical protein